MIAGAADREPAFDLHEVEELDAAPRSAGIEDLRWHDLRRTCGCRLLQVHGLSMEQARDWLGHSSVITTEKIYAFLTVDDLQRAVGTGTRTGSTESTDQ